MKICPDCSTVNTNTTKFCTNCGRSLENVPLQTDSRQTPMENDVQIFAIAALVLGIFSIITYWATYFNVLSLLAGVVGVILGIKARNMIPIGKKGRGLANTGFVCSVIGVVLSFIGVFTCTLCAVCTQYIN